MAPICKLNSPDCLPRAEQVILEGGLLVYPTDTLYGFGVDARSPTALELLTRIKGRGGPYSIAVASLEMVETHGDIPDERRAFVLSHLPGKVTIIVKARTQGLSSRVLGPGGTVGIRMPDHPFPTKLTERLNFPITTTSVNRTGEPPLNDPAAIARQFANDVDLIVDGGPLPASRGSTVYDLTGKEIAVLRNPS
ncbi:MAG: L-threonylcarbamoyladenylate synthase [Fidelibacterota bacterium]